MEHSDNTTILLGILIYFLLQSMSNLVEAIYMIDLLNTQIDANVLGLLFFFSTALLLLIRTDGLSLQIFGTATVVFKLLYPLFHTTLRLLLAGMGVGAALIFLPLYLHERRDYNLGRAAAMGTLLSITARTLYHTLDITEYGYYQILGWLLGATAIYLLLTEKSVQADSESPKNVTGRTTPAVLGMFSVFTLLYMGFATPAVFTRWGETNYIFTISLAVLAIGAYLLLNPQISKKVVWTWNILLFASLLLSIVLNQVEFLTDTTHSPIMVGASSWYMQLPIYLSVLLMPVLFIDLQQIIQLPIKRGKLLRAFLLAEFAMVILIFMLILTNVWGYVDPISQYFRGLFWLPYLFATVGVLGMLPHAKTVHPKLSIQFSQQKMLATIVVLLTLTTILAAVFNNPHPQTPASTDTVTIMTFNIQQGVNATGQKNYQKQLELIKSIQPDIIGLQESDTPKINTGASDVVRFFADQLDFFCYYGPKTVMQTYGVALLSRYPITHAESFFTIGNEDEVGSLFAQVQVGSNILNIFVNHPAGNDAVDLDHTRALLAKADGLSNVIMLGDFNWDEQTQYYTLITAEYKDTWRDRYSSGIDNNGLNMSRTIDHIFVSPTFTVQQSVYIPSPASQTDHPVYWTRTHF